jgi:3-oxoadipate enol-lactonase
LTAPRGFGLFWHMPHADINGQRIFFEDSGGTGPTLVLAHGFIMDHTMFDPQVAGLAPGVRVVRWDVRAHGRTEWDGKPFTYWDAADDCIGLLDHLGLQQAVIGGMSQGGFVSLRAALRYPARVKGLVLIAAQAGVDTPETLAHNREMVEAWVAMGAFESIVKVVAGFILGPEQYWEPWTSRWREIPRDRVRAASDALLGREDITARLGEIRCPALVFHGTDDRAITADRAEALASGLAGCEGLVRVEGAPHAANLTHPAQVNPPLGEFLRRHG